MSGSVCLDGEFSLLSIDSDKVNDSGHDWGFVSAEN
jgi:hypothetical protein